jgi:nicotinamide riboside kinase
MRSLLSWPPLAGVLGFKYSARPIDMKIALLGAESTGKTQLAHALAAHLRAAGRQAIAVDEYLREWCEQHARTPQPHEQAHIAQEQQARIEAAAASHEVVIADTTPLMTAVYSEFIFQDKSLHEVAAVYQRTFDLTLLTGLDMPWQPDGIQRDGEHVRAPVDTLLRQLLQSAGIAFEVIYGHGDERLQSTLYTLQRYSRTAQETTNSIAPHADSMLVSGQKSLKKWQWNCEKCSDPDCEHRIFRSLQFAE